MARLPSTAGYVRIPIKPDAGQCVSECPLRAEANALATSIHKVPRSRDGLGIPLSKVVRASILGWALAGHRPEDARKMGGAKKAYAERHLRNRKLTACQQLFCHRDTPRVDELQRSLSSRCPERAVKMAFRELRKLSEIGNPNGHDSNARR